jgi:CHAT domain-containing protein
MLEIHNAYLRPNRQFKLNRFILSFVLFYAFSQVSAQSFTELFSQYMSLDKKGNYAAAAPILEQIVIAVEKEYGRDIMYFNVLIYTRDNYLKISNHAKAAEFCVRLDSIYGMKSPYSDDGLMNLNQTFSNFTYAGNYGKAQIYADKCLNEYEKRYGKSTTDYATCLSNVGISYQSMSLHEKSLEYFNQALKIVEKVEPNSQQHFSILNNVMTGEFLAGRKKEATDYASEVLKMAKKMYQHVPLVIAHFYSNYGIHLQNIGEFDNARIQFETAEYIFTKNQLTTGETYAEFLSNYSVFLFETGNLISAKNSAALALHNYTNIYGSNSHRTFYAKINLGIINALNGDGYNALSQSTNALEQYLEQFKSNQFVLTEKDRIESRKFFDQAFGMMIGEVLIKNKVFGELDKSSFFGELYNLHINSKGMVLSSINKTKNQILASENISLVTKYQEWIQLKNQISYYNGLTLGSLAQAGINLENQKNEAAKLEKDIFTESGLINQQKDKWIKWQEVQENLTTGEVAIEIIRIEYKDDVTYMAMILAHESLKGPVFVKLNDASLLENSGHSYYKNCIEYEIRDLKSYDLYWKPIADAVRQIQPANQRIILSTEGVYNLVSVNTFIVPESGKFLIEDHQINLTTNTINLVEKTSLPSGTETWLIGDPDFTAPPSINNERGSEVRLLSNLKFELSKLPGTYKEVTEIHNILSANKNIHLLTSEEANESTVKKIQSPKTLHFATHGYFGQNNQAMLNTGIALSGLNTFYNNPSAYSGDDGLLTSYEIQGMNLTGTELVVLSACETGLGNLMTGEGVFGLQRAFRIAGAETLIMSLWKVDDDATQKLMTSFYRNQLTFDLNKAFRMAQSELMKEYPNPKYWGAFLLVE